MLHPSVPSAMNAIKIVYTNSMLVMIECRGGYADTNRCLIMLRHTRRTPLHQIALKHIRTLPRVAPQCKNSTGQREHGIMLRMCNTLLWIQKLTRYGNSTSTNLLLLNSNWGHGCYASVMVQTLDSISLFFSRALSIERAQCLCYAMNKEQEIKCLLNIIVSTIQHNVHSRSNFISLHTDQPHSYLCSNFMTIDPMLHFKLSIVMNIILWFKCSS